ncbi:prefoldin subunit beta [Candidatus Woesearchaeota archaeon]|nr:prefoldin subunit beta [Candidatus Woesearchaeota archaeon]
MKVDEQTQQKIKQLSLLEQNLQSTALQKQGFQVQLMETESAIDELKDKKSGYKIVANILIQSDAETLKKELEEKKEVLELRIKSLEKQESKLRDKASELQKQVMGQLESKE